MIKVIIISYFYPPSNFVGGERIAAWAKHLNESGIYPIVITRAWNENQKDLVDPLDANELIREKTDTYEIRRLPYKRTLRDKLSKYPALKVLQKALTLKEMIFSNYFLSSLPYLNFYTEARSIIEQEDIKAVIASGRPFQSFFIGHTLKKEFDLLWIPDYRDEWTTHKHIEEQGAMHKLINKLERKSELKWTSNADFFISVSQDWVKIINELIKKEGKVVYNGYNQLETSPKRATDPDVLTITYAGTLYPSQDISILINACKKLINKGKKINVRFIGTNMMSAETDRATKLTKGYESNFEFIDRVPKSELEPYLFSSDVLYLTSFEKIKGWFPVKLFEYYASGVPLLLCPSDDSSMEEFITITNCGVVANDINECESVLSNWIEKKKNAGEITFDRNIEKGSFYSRKNQTKLLAEFILEGIKDDSESLL